MKNLKVVFVVALFTLFSVSAMAQQRATVGSLLSGLVNVNVGAVQVDASDLVDVSNVLNNNQIDILRNAIQNNPIASNNQDVLNNLATNLLRDAEIIDETQVAVVVGVLSGQLFYLIQ